MKDFEKAIADHEMKVVKDDGVHRHLHFARPKSSTYWFEIVTWTGALCITGDMGTYVFRRLSDMFEFFRGEKINPGYWGEKLQAFDKNAGYREFSPAEFRIRVKEHFDGYWYEAHDTETKDECWRDIVDCVLSKADDGECAAYQAVYDYSFSYMQGKQRLQFTFQDFFDGGGTEVFTHHFIWCLRAIVWAIEQYDKGKADGV